MSLELPTPSIDLEETEIQRRFDQLQRRLVPLWEAIKSLDDDGEQTIVVLPSLTVDFAALQGPTLQAYEERFLFLLLLLRQPQARVIYITCQPIQSHVVDYYLGLLPGVISSHARARLHLVSPQDGAPQPLSVKLLQRPRLIEKIRALIPDKARAHMVPFNTTRYERDLALRLGIPMYGADPRFNHYGTKSGCRKLFAKAGVSAPVGLEDLASTADLENAILEIRKSRPDVHELMVKHNDGVSGDGNAVLDMRGLDGQSRDAARERIQQMQLEAKSMSIDEYLEKLKEYGGIVEERIVGDPLLSPSAQLRVTPLGEVELLSTHDQLLGGPTGQKFLGCVFPADPAYAVSIAEEAHKVGKLLAEDGVLGRSAIDFVVAKRDGRFRPYAIEINLRKGGTTHPFLTLQFLTGGTYQADRGVFVTPAGIEKCFVASDNVDSPYYRLFTPEDLFDIAVRHRLHWDHTHEEGVVFHMMTALGDKGRLGMTALAGSREAAHRLYDKTVATLDDEALRASRHPTLSEEVG